MQHSDNLLSERTRAHFSLSEPKAALLHQSYLFVWYAMISEIYESDILESGSYFSSHGLELVGRLVESSLLKVDDGYVLPGHVEFKGK